MRDEGGILACPQCRAIITQLGSESLYCGRCNSSYSKSHGYYVLMSEDSRPELKTIRPKDSYIELQVSIGARLVDDYLLPVVGIGREERVLDVGCGVGNNMMELRRRGFEAYGVDLPELCPAWAAAKADPDCFFSADACRLPFADASFGLVISLGVIEHVGTCDGESNLLPDYWRFRQAFAAELLRVCRPRGRIVISCPNLRFPIDIQHGPAQSGLRRWLFAKTGMNVHAISGKYHLLSFGQVKRLFRTAGASACEAMPLRGYFGFNLMRRGLLARIKGLSEAYVSHIPALLRPTCFNPYVCAMIRK